MIAAVLAVLLLLPAPSTAARGDLWSMSAEACEQASALDDHSSQPDRVTTHDVCRWAPLVVYVFGSVELSAEVLCVMAFESGGDPGADLHHRAADGSIDRMVGLMQLNHDNIQGRQVKGVERWKAQRLWKTQRLVKWLKNPVVNLSVTQDFQKAGGWGPWAARHNCGL